MNRRLLHLFVGLWLAFFFPLFLSAQKVGFSLPVVDNATHNQVMNLPVRVTNFDSILSLQFVILWDTTVLKYLTYNGYSTLPNASGDNFGASEASKGILRFAWPVNSVPDSIAHGLSLPDSAAIFKIRFLVVGNDTSSTALTFTQLPPVTYFEVVRYPNKAYSLDSVDRIELHNGFVAVGYTTPTDEPAMLDADFPVQVFPNPFSDKTQVAFDLPAAAQVSATLTDASGRLVFSQELDCPAGRNGLELHSTQFPSHGAYFLTLRSTHFTHTCPVYFH